jgi:hypothetical protein
VTKIFYIQSNRDNIMAFGDFTVTRASTKNVIGSNGLYQSVANNVPAFEFNADGSYRGLLVEPGATNLNPYSIDIRSSGEGAPSSTWTANDTLVLSTNNLAPDGTLTATRIRGNGATNRARQMSITGTSGAPYTGSFFIRRVSGATVGTVNVRTGDVGQVATVNPTTTWQRFSHTASPTTTTVRLALVFPNDTDEFDVWQAQLETGSVATSPIVTTGSTASRVADSVTLASASSLIGQSAGTLYAEIQSLNFNSTSLRNVLAVSDGTGDNRIVIRSVTSQDNRYQAFVFTGGVTQALISQSANNSNGAILKIALAYATDDVALYIGGASIGTDTLATIPACDRVDIGQFLSGDRMIAGHIRSVALFPTRLSNAQLETLTTL